MSTPRHQLAIAHADPAAETWTDLDGLGIDGATLTLMTAGTDSLVLTLATQNALTDDPAFAYNTLLRLRRLETGAGGAETQTLLFLGRVQPFARTATGSEESATVTVLGLWDYLDKTVMRQDWMDSGDVAHTAPRVVLFSGGPHARLATGAQIEQCVAVARDAGCPCAEPRPGDIAPGFTPPFDEQTNITVAQAVCKALANHPHAVCWFDYSERAPRLHVAQRQSLPPVTLDIAQDHEQIAITSREDLQPPAVAICYQKPVQDGDNQFIHTEVDYAPKVQGETQAEAAARLARVDTVWAVFDLAGFSAQYQTREQTLKTEPLNWDGNKLSAAWWRRWVPTLNDSNLRVDQLKNPSYSGSGEMPNILLEGVAEEWMRVATEREKFEVDALLVTGTPSDPREVRWERVMCELTTTDGASKTYRSRELTSQDTGDSIPAGLAAQMWDEWSQLHHDGSLAIVRQDAPLGITPGRTLNLAGGRPEWAAMRAMVKRVTLDIAAGETEVEFGTPEWIDLDSRVAWYRACRNRRFSVSRQITQPQEPAPGDGAAGITGLPVERDGGNAAHIIRRVFDNPANPVDHRVDIHAAPVPGGFEFAAPADGGTPRTVRILEIPVPVINPATKKVTGARVAQVLACEPYGAEAPLHIPGGGPAPDNGWGPVTEIPAPPPAGGVIITDWIDGEPVIDLNSGSAQDGGLRLSAVLPGGDRVHYPFRFIAARFPAKGDEAESLGITRGLTAEDDQDDDNPLTARLAGVDEPPAHKDAQRVFGFASDDAWGLLELESMFKLDRANNRIYIDLSGYANFKSLAAASDTWDFGTDANHAGMNGATIEYVADVRWVNNKLIVDKRTATLFKFGLKSISAATPSDVVSGQDC